MEYQETLLRELPDIKLSYENITHKTVSHFDFILAIPEGTRCLAWFIEWENKPTCFLLELVTNDGLVCNINIHKRNIANISIANACFARQLCYGTVLYGTLFKHLNQSFFSIEDIHYYKGSNVSRENWKEKMDITLGMLKRELKQVSYNQSFTVFGLPLMSNSHQDLDRLLHNGTTYKIAFIQYRSLNATKTSHFMFYHKYITYINDVNNHTTILPANNKTNNHVPNTHLTIVFQVKPDIQNDIYHLYARNNHYYDTATIPDYQTSVMMNKLFRIIKENDNLDKLEESDDEEEFECANEDKFVHLDKTMNMKCRFHRKFRKWIPVEVVNDPPSSVQDILAVSGSGSGYGKKTMHKNRT